MSNSLSVCAKIIPTGGERRSITRPLLHKLMHFTAEHYHLENKTLFIDNILRPEQEGEIIFFYGGADELVGYTRIYHQHIDIKSRRITVYSATTYNNKTHNTSFAAARQGLIQTMKYKLSHPKEELVHFSCVSSPSKYQFLAELCSTIYPNPDHDTPKQIALLIKKLRENNGWPSCSTHPFIINGQIVKKHQTLLETTNNERLANCFLSLNPEYSQGSALLVCIPLNLKNIGYGIRQLLTQSHHQEHDHLSHPMSANVDV